MSVDRDHTERIAALARLRFEPPQLDRLTEELNRILDHVEELRSLDDTAPEERDDSPQGWLRASTRASAADEPDALDEELETLAPDFREGFFVVPPLPGVRDEEEG